jgi:hypothetical protein
VKGVLGRATPDDPQVSVGPTLEHVRQSSQDSVMPLIAFESPYRRQPRRLAGKGRDGSRAREIASVGNDREALLCQPQPEHVRVDFVAR